MPLIEFQNKKSGSIYSLWQITEELDELLALFREKDMDSAGIRAISNHKKKLEWLSSRLAMAAILESRQITGLNIVNDILGKPYLPGNTFQISIAHCHPYAAAAFHPESGMGIDLERVQPKLLNLAPRFLNAEEQESAGNNLEKLCIYWCAKECLYKLFGKKSLSFRENIFIASPPADENLLFYGEIRQNQQVKSIPLLYRRVNGHILCYTDG